MIREFLEDPMAYLGGMAICLGIIFIAVPVVYGLVLFCVGMWKVIL